VAVVGESTYENITNGIMVNAEDEEDGGDDDDDDVDDLRPSMRYCMRVNSPSGGVNSSERSDNPHASSDTQLWNKASSNRTLPPMNGVPVVIIME
jgi:hypothetical protein